MAYQLIIELDLPTFNHMNPLRTVMWFHHMACIEGKFLKTPEMVKICPKCASTHVYWIAGGLIGAIYRCNDCGYEGTFVLEVKPKDIEKFRKEINSGAENHEND